MATQVETAIDTNIFVSVINKESGYNDSKKILDWIDEGQIRGLVSTIVLAEMASGYEERPLESDDFLAHILASANYVLIDVTVPLALDAGNLRAKRGLGLPDALIVASALRRGGKFLVSNDKNIAGIEVEGIKVLTASEFVKLFLRTRDDQT